MKDFVKRIKSQCKDVENEVKRVDDSVIRAKSRTNERFVEQVDAIEALEESIQRQQDQQQQIVLNLSRMKERQQQQSPYKKSADYLLDDMKVRMSNLGESLNSGGLYLNTTNNMMNNMNDSSRGSSNTTAFSPLQGTSRSINVFNFHCSFVSFFLSFVLFIHWFVSLPYFISISTLTLTLTLNLLTQILIFLISSFIHYFILSFILSVFLHCFPLYFVSSSPSVLLGRGQIGTDSTVFYEDSNILQSPIRRSFQSQVVHTDMTERLGTYAHVYICILCVHMYICMCLYTYIFI